MAVNLVKYKDELLGAWKEVVDDKNSTNWALFGYDKQSYDLRVVSKGDGGLEELTEELNCGKIMYAFCKVEDPNTSLPKFILINWQGEGAPLVKKGCCANHFMDIAKFFKGSNITITARTEEDVEPGLILEKVSKCTASKFNFKERSDPTENSKPVGSVYKRIQPAREISSTERERFWMKEQEEEKKRIDEERKKAEEARNRIAEEVKEREMKDARAREQRFQERSRSIDKLREAENNAQNSTHSKVDKKLWEQQLQEDMKEEEERRRRSDHLRSQRNEEAQALIAQRTVNAKAMFEPSTYTGTYATQPAKLTNQQRAQQPTASYEPQNLAAASAPVTNSRNALQNNQAAAVTSPPTEFTYTRNLLKDGLPPRQESDMENLEEEQNWEEPTLEAPPHVKDPLTEMMAEHGIRTPQQPAVEESPQVIVADSSNPGLRARALYDYQAADDTEISFDPDDIITHIEQIDEGWWQGLGPDGTYGLFPANYVELVN
ncbi:drebrin-like protein [Ornithodoros turicata]